MNNFYRWIRPAARMPERKTANSLVSLVSGRPPDWSSRSYQSLAVNGYARNPVARRSISLVAQAAARVPLLVDDCGRRVTEHPVLELLAAPNPSCAGPELVELSFAHLMLNGNAYIEVVPASESRFQLYVLRPDRVSPVVASDGWIKAYDYRAGGRKRRIAPSRRNRVPLVHLKEIHPVSDHFGHAPIEAAMDAIDTHNKASDWHKSLLDNAARPSGALVYNAEAGSLTGEQFSRLKEELNASFQGSGNAGRPMVLEGGLDWKSLSMSPRDMDFIETKNAAARDIAMAFGVPPMLLCIAGDNTYANYREANRAFWRLTMIPQLVRFCAVLTRDLKAIVPGDWSIVPNLEAIEAIADERLANWSTIDALQTLTKAEKRELFGLRSAN